MNKREQAMRDYLEKPMTEEEKALLESFREEKEACSKIKELRERTQWTQKEFAEYFGISVRNIQEWEQERKSPPPYLVGLMERLLESEKP